MGDYIDFYKRRVNTMNGSNIADTQKKSTEHFINSAFQDSPDYTLVDIDGEETEVRVLETKNPNVKTLLFRPGTLINRGALVVYRDYHWLVIGFTETDLFPKAEMKLCNNTITLKTGETRTITGYGDTGRPIYDIQETTETLDCIVETKSYINKFTEFNEQINIPDGRLLITFQNVPINVQEGLQFEMYDNIHRVIQIDRTQTYGDEGVIMIVSDKITGGEES